MSDKNQKKPNKIPKNNKFFFPTRKFEPTSKSSFDVISSIFNVFNTNRHQEKEQVEQLRIYNYIKLNFIDEADYKVNFSAFLKVFESVYEGGKFDNYRKIKNDESKFHRLFNIIDKFKPPNEELEPNEVESIKNFINKMDLDYNAVQLLENISKHSDSIDRINMILDISKINKEFTPPGERNLSINDIASGSENISRPNAKHINPSISNYPERRAAIYKKPSVTVSQITRQDKPTPAIKPPPPPPRKP